MLRYGTAIAAAILSAACGGGASGGVPVSDQTVEKVIPAPEVDAGVAPLPSARQALQYLPGDMNMLLHVNWRDLRGSGVVGSKQFKELKEKLFPMAGKCAQDFSELIDTVTVGLSGREQPEESLIAVVSGDIQQSQVEQCLSSLGAPPKAGRFVLDSEEFHIHWPKEGIALLSHKVSASEMQTRLQSGSVLSRERLMPWIRKTDSHAEAWGAAESGALRELLGGFGAFPEGLYFNVDIDDAISIFISLQFSQADKAREMEGFARQFNQFPSQDEPENFQLETVEVNREEGRLDIVVKLRPPTLASP